MKLIIRTIRFLALSLLHPHRTSFELVQSNFWFEQTQEAFDRCMSAKTPHTFEIARQQFKLSERRWRKHTEYICPR